MSELKPVLRGKADLGFEITNQNTEELIISSDHNLDVMKSCLAAYFWLSQ